MARPPSASSPCAPHHAGSGLTAAIVSVGNWQYLAAGYFGVTAQLEIVPVANVPERMSLALALVGPALAGVALSRRKQQA